MKPIKVLFICHGNICRSPMAEYMFKDLVEKKGISKDFLIDSAATSREEIGNPVYPPARNKLAGKGISCSGHRAKQVTEQNYDEFDYLIIMEGYNYNNLMRIIGSDSDGKVHKLLEYTGTNDDIDDPWYTGNFDITYREIEEGLEAFLEYLGY